MLRLAGAPCPLLPACLQVILSSICFERVRATSERPGTDDCANPCTSLGMTSRRGPCWGRCRTSESCAASGRAGSPGSLGRAWPACCGSDRPPGLHSSECVCVCVWGRGVCVLRNGTEVCVGVGVCRGTWMHCGRQSDANSLRAGAGLPRGGEG